jgi:hypothetical protein
MAASSRPGRGRPGKGRPGKGRPGRGRPEGRGRRSRRGGQTVPEGQPRYLRGYLTALLEWVRSEAKVPTLVGGYLTTRDEVNTVVAAGRADLCLLELP